MKEVVVEDTSKNPDWEAFSEQLKSQKDAKGKMAPRYGVFDLEYELGEGEGKRLEHKSVSLSLERLADSLQKQGCFRSIRHNGPSSHRMFKQKPTSQF